MTTTTSTATTKTYEIEIPRMGRYDNRKTEARQQTDVAVTKVLDETLPTDWKQFISLTTTPEMYCIEGNGYKDGKFKSCKKGNTLQITPKLIAELTAYVNRRRANAAAEKRNRREQLTEMLNPVVEKYTVKHDYTKGFKNVLNVAIRLTDAFDVQIEQSKNNESCSIIIDRNGNVREPKATYATAGSTLSSVKDFVERFTEPFADITVLAETVKSELPAGFFGN